MDKFLEYLKDRSIHIAGVTGAEGSNILRFLKKHGIDNIVVHDFGGQEELEKNFKLCHKGITTGEKNRLLQQFKEDLIGVTSHFGQDYLIDVTSADIIFVPQSWRLYKQHNAPLWEAKQKNIPFYSLTRLYLDFVKAKIIAVTGTVGKGSTANIIFQLLKKALLPSRQVYFAGNETWMVQAADKIDQMKKEDILVLEISHRQLQDGFSRAPQIVVFTNLYPNHLDEVDWQEYQKLKLSLILSQKTNDIAILNYDSAILREKADDIKSKIIFYSEKEKHMNTKNVQNIYGDILDIKSVHYTANLLAASTTVNILGINGEQIVRYLSSVSPLSARLEYLGETGGIKFYDDIKSTSPWATLAAINKLGWSTILICGGRGKGIDYQDFANQLKTRVLHAVILKSEISQKLASALAKDSFTEFANLEEGLKFAFQQAQAGDNILVSPAAGFFYTDFIKGKKSIRKIIMELHLKYSGDPASSLPAGKAGAG